MVLGRIHRGVVTLDTISNRVSSVVMTLVGFFIGLFGVFFMKDNMLVGSVAILVGFIIAVIGIWVFKSARRLAERGIRIRIGSSRRR